MISNSLFIKNRNKLLSILPSNSIAIIQSNDEMPRNGDQLFPFRQNSDLFYMCGLNQPKVIVCICNSHPNPAYSEILFAVKPNPDYAIWYGHQPDKAELQEISGIKTIFWLEDFETVIKDLMINTENIYLSSNEYIKFTPDFQDRNHRFSLLLKENFPLHKYHRLAPIINELRLVKEPEEIAMIETACNITGKAFQRVLKTIKPGMMEYEVEAEINHEFMINNVRNHAYQPIIAAGENACTLHYIENSSVCNEGELLLMDFGAEFGNYASDCSRTIPVSGKFTIRQKQYYQAVLNVYNEIFKEFVVGNCIDQLNKKTSILIEKELIRLELFSIEEVEKQSKESPLYMKYYMHGVSHFMGLDVHDVGSKQTVLKAGMILTCEPGIYNKDEKIGIRLENDILITEEGPINLMKNIPIEIEEIEKIMNNK